MTTYLEEKIKNPQTHTVEKARSEGETWLEAECQSIRKDYPIRNTEIQIIHQFHFYIVRHENNVSAHSELRKLSTPTSN